VDRCFASITRNLVLLLVVGWCARALAQPIDAGAPLQERPPVVDVDAGGDTGGLADAGVTAAPEDAPVAAPASAPAAASPPPPPPPLPPAPPKPPQVEPGREANSSVLAFKLIFGLSMLLALAYIGGHPWTLRLQERLGLGGAISVGFPFVALGLIAARPSVGILSEAVIPNLRPVLQFGLGWIGFIIGAQLDIRVLDRVPTGSAYLVLLEALAPFAVTAAACGAVMMLGFGLPFDDLSVWRDVVLLGAAAAMTAPRRFSGFANRSWEEGAGADALLGQLDEIAGVVGLLFLMAYFRPEGGEIPFELPGTWWLFISLGLGVIVGVLIFVIIRVPQSGAEFLAVVLGGIAFAAGLAGVLRLSPMVVCFVAGTLVTNFPNQQREDVFRIMNRLERPLHLLFLMIAGALWSVSDWRGWALVPLFVIARIAGRWLGIFTTRRVVGMLLPATFTEKRERVRPMSTLSIALVISAEAFRDVGLSWAITAVIGGAIITEILVGMVPDPTAAPAPTEPAEPPDELSEQLAEELERDRRESLSVPGEGPPGEAPGGSAPDQGGEGGPS